MSKLAVPAALIAIIIAVGVVAYTLGTNQEKEAARTGPTPTNIEQQTTAPTATTTIEPTSGPRVSPNRNVVIENIQASVESKNYAALEGYMTANVSVLLYASECCGILSAQKATEQMSYLNSATPPWDFSLNSAISQKLIAADPANFAGRIIGISSDGMVVSFNLNNENKIDKIFLSADYKLISP